MLYKKLPNSFYTEKQVVLPFQSSQSLGQLETVITLKWVLKVSQLILEPLAVTYLNPCFTIMLNIFKNEYIFKKELRV